MASLYRKLLPVDAGEGPSGGRVALATHCFLISRGYLNGDNVASIPPEIDTILKGQSTACTIVYESASSGRVLTLAWTLHENTLAICQVLDKSEESNKQKIQHVGTFSLQTQDLTYEDMMKAIERDMGRMIEVKGTCDDKEVQTEIREEPRRIAQPHRSGGDSEGNFEGMLVGPNSRIFTNPVPGSRFDPIFPDNPLGLMGGDDVHGSLPRVGNLFPSSRGGGGGRGFFG